MRASPYRAKAPVNTFALMEHCRACVVFSSTTGIESAMIGRRVVAGGDVYLPAAVSPTNAGREMNTSTRFAAQPSAISMRRNGSAGRRLLSCSTICCIS